MPRNLPAALLRPRHTPRELILLVPTLEIAQLLLREARIFTTNTNPAPTIRIFVAPETGDKTDLVWLYSMLAEKGLAHIEDLEIPELALGFERKDRT